MDITTAKSDVQSMFDSLAPIVLEVAGKYSKEADKLIDKLVNANSFTNEELREAILQLSIEAYMFSMSKDASILKQDCATTLLKESQAKLYNATQGTQVVRQNQSIVDSVDKQVVNMLYSAVANMMKTKLDEIHRLLNTLNSILISRNAEAKLNAGNPVFSERAVAEIEQERNIY